VSQKKTVAVLFFNNFVKCWPILIICGMQN